MAKVSNWSSEGDGPINVLDLEILFLSYEVDECQTIIHKLDYDLLLLPSESNDFQRL